MRLGEESKENRTPLMKLRNLHLLRVSRTSVCKAASASRMCTRFRSSSSDERILWPRVAPRPTRPPAPLVAKRRPLLARSATEKNSLSLSFILERKETTRLTQGRSKKEEPFLFFLLPKRCPPRCLRGKDFEERIFDRSSALKSAKERMARIQRDRVWRVSVRIKLSFEAQNAFSISIRGG